MRLPFDMSWFEVVDLLLLSCGTVWLMSWIVRITRRHAAADLARGFAASSNAFTATDLLLAAMLFLFLPSILAELLRPLWSPPETTMTPSDPAHPPTAPFVIGLTIGHGLAIGVLLVMGRRRITDGWTGWGLTTRRFGMELLTAIRLYITICPIIFIVFKATQFTLDYFDVPTMPHASIELLRQADTPGWLWWLTIFNALVIAAVVEELFFRGLVQTALSRGRGGAGLAIFLTALIFGMIHYPYTETIPPLVVFGLILGWQYARTGSLTRVILLHAVFNGKTLLWLALGAPLE